MTRRAICALSGIAVALACAGMAWAHQTATNNGVTVTVHVAPDDEPVATQEAVIIVEKVSTRTGRFSWPTCRCALQVSNAASEVLLKGRAVPKTTFTLPEPGAYRINLAGRVKRTAGWRWFKVSFAIRASAPAAHTRKDFR